MEKRPIIIAATSLDAHAYTPVSNTLEAKGFPVVIYRTDKVLSGEDSLCINLADTGMLTMSYNGTGISPDEVGAAWYRKIAAFKSGAETDDQAKQLHISAEIQALHDTMWSVYADDVWLNSPARMRRAEKKLSQLALAHELGFRIPQTVISNDWEDIDRILLAASDQFIVKTIRGIVSDRESMKAMYTTLLNREKLEALAKIATPFPGIYQPFVDKLREWRVTVVGDKVFPAAIYTDEEAKDDWRKHQLKSTVRFKYEPLPEGVEEKCFHFLGRLGLRFGAFDLIETMGGQVVFLECNPNGQYGWLEKELKFPISDSIAYELEQIAISNAE